MNVEQYMNQIVVVTLEDGSRNRRVLKMFADINPITGEVLVQVHDGTEVMFVPVNSIYNIELTMLN